MKETRHAFVKQTPSISKKKGAATKATTVSSAPSAFDVDEVASLFSAIKQTKAQTRGGVTAAKPQLVQRGVGKRAEKVNGFKDASVGTDVSASSPSPRPQSKPVRDGLYHAPEKSVQMSDNQFFSGTWLKEDRAAAAAASSSAAPGLESSEATEDFLRKEGVDRIVSIEELSKMLSRHSRAGTTANCPFDCDCCF
ncbi:hypothetical protein JKF63_01234 [Porcisia hertigi]|uniref:Uncharacterized protein n=1 Tax=Porcisia hertigi TaxID=2761500 RepID=A0A836ICJ7_9TRYP|nr:hypothetical protein JKF63_01234 [Porcisia hertigi]